MKWQKLWQKIDIFFFLLAPVLATSLSLIYKANLLFSTLLFFGLPAAYLTLRNRHAIKRSLIFTAILTVAAALFIDYPIALSGAWYVPTIFPFRFLGQVPVEDIVWGFLFIYSIIMFYEHFLDKGTHNVFDKKFKHFVTILILATTVLLFVYLNNQGILRLPFAYFTIGTASLTVPVMLFLTHFPKFISKYVKVAIYFGVLAFMNELTALQLGHWYFPGREFVGWLQFGSLRFPFEEFFFYVVLGATAVLCYFEYLDDNHFKREARRYT